MKRTLLLQRLGLTLSLTGLFGSALAQAPLHTFGNGGAMPGDGMLAPPLPPPTMPLQPPPMLPAPPPMLPPPPAGQSSPPSLPPLVAEPLPHGFSVLPDGSLLPPPGFTELPDGSFLAPDSFAPMPAAPRDVVPELRKRQAAERAAGAFRPVFYDNDFSYLNDPYYDGHYFGDGLKQLSMPGAGKIDFGGELRLRYHSEHNMRNLGAFQGLTGADDDFLLTRLRLFSNYRINDYFRFYGEYLFADSGGQDFTNRPTEINRGEANNLFIDVDMIRDGGTSLTARLGRQELIYGNQRLVSPLDWANTRRTFDGYKLLYSGESWDIDGFFVHPVDRSLARQGTNQWDRADTSIDFYGVYGTRKGLPIGLLDTYYLGVDYQRSGANFHTLGSRLSGELEEWLYELEGGAQFGENGDGSNHSAGFFVAGLGRQVDLNIAGRSWQPTLWAWYDYASGEDDFSQSGRFGDGFDHLFPLAHKYLGYMDLFGRRNLHDINAQVITPLSDRVSLLLWYHYFLLDERTTPYSVTMQPYNTVAPAADRELGHELDLLLSVDFTARRQMLVGYSFFNPGDYYKQTSGGVAGANGIASISDAHFFYLQYQMRF